jgi:hypothetical protein
MRPGPATQAAFAMRESRRCPSLRSPARFLEPFCNVSRQPTLSCSGATSPKCSCIQIAPAGCSPAMRDRSEEAATPGLPTTLSRFGNLSSLSFDSAHADPKAPAAEPALRDHWQRDIHACSDCTFSHPETVRNQKSHPRCANPVDDEDCLWKGAEKMGEIQLSRASRPDHSRIPIPLLLFF